MAQDVGPEFKPQYPSKKKRIDETEREIDISIIKAEDFNTSPSLNNW
jgi:hypothetical protein